MRSLTRWRALLPEALALSALLACVAAAAFHPLYAIDFFWHLKLGELIASTGHIPQTDLFSAVQPDRPYVQFNWLWEWAVAQLVAAAGFHGVRVAQAVLLVLSFGLLYANVRKRVRLAEPALAFVALAFVLFEDRFQERPAALVLGFVAALVPVLLGERAQRKTLHHLGRLTYVALLAVLWSNLHGGESVLLLLSIGALLAGELCERYLLKREAPVTSVPAFVVSLVALALSPTWLPGLLSWTRAIGPELAIGNQEWLPTYTMLRYGVRPAFVLIACGPSLVAIAYLIEQTRRVKRLGRAAIDPAEWLLCAGYLVLSEQAVRNAFLCLLPVLFMLQRMAATPLAARRATRTIFAVVALALTAIAVEDAIPYSYGSWQEARDVLRYDLSPNAQPELVADFVHEAQLEGAIINDGTWGGYLIWRLWPRCSVFADSRFHFTPEMWPVFSASHDPARRQAALEAAFARWGIELAVFRGPTFLLPTPPAQWRLLFKAGDQEVYQRAGGVHAATNLERTRRWLLRAGVSVPASATDDSLPTLATELGAQQFFGSAYQQRQLREARAGLEAADPDVRAHAELRFGQLLWQAGLYERALPELERALPLMAADARPAYFAALCRFALGDRNGALELARSLTAAPKNLSALQRARLAAILQAQALVQ